MEKLEKRTWHYILPPVAYDMRCDKCWSGKMDDDTGTNIWWSEWQGMIWCYNCEIDTKGFDGVFGGPIPLHAAYMMGLVFDRFNLETNEIQLFNLKSLEWDSIPKAAKAMLEAGNDEDLSDIYGDITRRIAQKSFYTPLYEMVERLRSVILSRKEDK